MNDEMTEEELRSYAIKRLIIAVPIFLFGLFFLFYTRHNTPVIKQFVQMVLGGVCVVSAVYVAPFYWKRFTVITLSILGAFLCFTEAYDRLLFSSKLLQIILGIISYTIALKLSYMHKKVLQGGFILLLGVKIGLFSSEPYLAGTIMGIVCLLLGLFLFVVGVTMLGPVVGNLFLGNIGGFLLYPRRSIGKPPPTISIAKSKRVAGDFQGALDHLEELLVNYPEHVEIYIEMIQILMLDLKKNQEADLIYLRGLKHLSEETKETLTKMYEAAKSHAIPTKMHYVKESLEEARANRPKRPYQNRRY